MYLTKLILDNFRSYTSKTFDFDPKINIIIGDNGSGKTNILEAIHFASSVKSFRASSLSKLISWDKTYSSVRTAIQKKDETLLLEVQLIIDPDSLQANRKLLINEISKTRKSYLGALKTVVFEPEDIRLVAGSPNRRREFLDSIFTTTEWRYQSALTQYNKALKHRNKLLDLINQGHSTKNELYYWDQSLVKNAAVINNFRSDFILHANNFFSTHSETEIRNLSLNYHQSPLTPERLINNFQFDLSRGYTQAGPHRDDFSFDNSIFATDDKKLANWGSRGQQRLAVLALRLAQIDFIETKSLDLPVLLLDDIFSELDSAHQHLVVSLCQHYQTIFTSSDDSSLTILPEANVIRL
jgi:DNA replication and repair protein RecF